MAIQWSCRSVAACMLTMVWCGTSAYAGGMTIVPGKCLGKISLGESHASVHRALGEPSETYPSKGVISSLSGLLMDDWRGKNWEPVVYVTYRAGRVVQISTDNPAFKTRDGLSVTCTLGQLRHYFKNLHRHTRHDAANPDRTHTTYYDPTEGLAFIDTNNAPSFDTLTVYRPGSRLLNDVE